MEETIKKILENGRSTGLSLLEIPTGEGKTNAVLDVMAQTLVKEPDSVKRFIFTTISKKNLPIAEFREKLIQLGAEKLFDEQVLFIDSNANQFRKAIHEVENLIPENIQQTKQFDDVKKTLKRLEAMENDFKTESDRNYKEQYLEEIEERKKKLTEEENSFRNMIRDEMIEALKGKNENTGKKDLLRLIRYDDNWKWVGKLYPTVFSDQKKVLFMSVDKFLLKNSTIIERSYYFVSSELVRDAVIFIDEFDSAKSVYTKRIISDDNKAPLDLISLFKELNAGFHGNELPTRLYAPSDDEENFYEELKQKIEQVYEDYKLSYTIQTQKNSETRSKNSFIFHDLYYLQMISGKEKRVLIRVNPEQKINELVVVDQRLKKTQVKEKEGMGNSQQLISLLARIKGLSNLFAIFALIISSRYEALPNDDAEEEMELNWEHKVSTTLHQFNFSPEIHDYFAKKMMVGRKSKRLKMRGGRKSSFYESGFQYYLFNDDPMHDLKSIIFLYDYPRTPEKMLEDLCKRAKVIGISATATRPTVLGNFDLEYLRYRLGRRYFDLNKEDCKRMLQRHQMFTEGYEQIQIHADLIQDECDLNDPFKEIIESSKRRNVLNTKMSGSLISDVDYCKKRYLRIAKAFKEFLHHEDIQSMLCLLNIFPREVQEKFNSNYLLELFDELLKEQGMKEKAKDLVVIMDSDDFDLQKEKLAQVLEAGKKKFVISTYQTLGAGQNLQYPVPKKMENKLVQTNTVYTSSKKDFDAIYLDDPTNLIVNMGMDETPFESLIQYIYQVESLVESRELSVVEGGKCIKTAINTHLETNKNTSFKQSGLNKTRSFHEYALRILEQGVGRICRTNLKNAHIYIYAEEKVAKHFEVEGHTERICSPEFQALTTCCKQFLQNQDTEYDFKKEIIEANKKTKKLIDTYIKNRKIWTHQMVDDWKGMRSTALKYPTAPVDLKGTNWILYHNYAKLEQPLNSYYFAQKDDYKEIDVAIQKTQECTMEVSEQAARLDRIMSIASIRNYFIKNEYATSFEPNGVIMSPVFFTNIYKGALGEETGRFLLEQIGKIELIEIENLEHFEKFDFKVKGRNVFIDFKLWSNKTEVKRSNPIGEAAKKATEIGADAVLIINIFGKKQDKIIEYHRQGVDLYEVPGLLVDSGAEVMMNIKQIADIQEIIECYEQTKEGEEDNENQDE